MHRRRFLAAAAAAATSSFLTRADEPPSLASFDREMETFIEARKIPGGALAVVKDGRLVHARGYGWSDKERQQRVEPTSLFRIASISKPITALLAETSDDWETGTIYLNMENQNPPSV